MSGKLIVLKTTPKLPKIYVIQAITFTTLMFCAVLLAGMAVLEVFLGSYATAVFNFGYATLILYFYSGIVFIEFPLSLRLLSSMDSAHFSRMERDYAIGMLRWKALPIHKGVGYIRMLANQSVVRLLQGEYDLAELSMLQALKYIENRKRWRQSGLAALIYNNMAVLKMRSGELEEGEEYANKALAIYTRGKSSKLGCLPCINIGWARLKQNKPQEAEQYLRKALKDLEGPLPLYVMRSSITFAHSNTLILLADALYRQDKVTEADQICDGIIKSLAADNSSIAITSVLVLTDLANTLIARKDFVRAEPLLEQTYALVRQFPTHPDCQPPLQSYSELLCLTHRESELPDLKNWVRPVLIEASP